MSFQYDVLLDCHYNNGTFISGKIINALLLSSLLSIRLNLIIHFAWFKMIHLKGCVFETFESQIKNNVDHVEDHKNYQFHKTIR